VYGYVYRTNRAGCKRCKEKIQLGVLRMGTTAEIMGHMGTQWRHLDCWSVPKKVTSTADIKGYDRVSAIDQSAIQQKVAVRYQVPRKPAKSKGTFVSKYVFPCE
jgi:hypothetical protein